MQHLDLYRALAEWAFHNAGHKPWPSEVSRLTLMLRQLQKNEPDIVIADMVGAAVDLSAICRSVVV